MKKLIIISLFFISCFNKIYIVPPVKEITIKLSNFSSIENAELFAKIALGCNYVILIVKIDDNLTYKCENH